MKKRLLDKKTQHSFLAYFSGGVHDTETLHFTLFLQDFPLPKNLSFGCTSVFLIALVAGDRLLWLLAAPEPRPARAPRGSQKLCPRESQGFPKRPSASLPDFHRFSITFLLETYGFGALAGRGLIFMGFQFNFD